jgi:sulfite reductase alpha subunit-like flavoprotein
VLFLSPTTESPPKYRYILGHYRGAIDALHYDDKTTTTTTRTTTTTTTMTTSSVERKIWVLFASQTGNSEQAARKIAALLPDKCRVSTSSSNSPEDSNYVCEVLQLDDFLELERAAWTPIVILCLSSYGVGQAPLGGYRFREFCDYLVDQHNNPTKNGNSASTTTTTPLLLQDLQFALLGLGDSKYTTFFENPTQTNRALELAGAKRIGTIGKADAASKAKKKAKDDDQPQGQVQEQEHKSQETVIDEWIDNLWKPLQDALRTSERVPPERLLQMQHDTCAICAQINPDFKMTKRSSSNGSSTKSGAGAAGTTTTTTVAMAIAIIAIVLAFVLPPLVFK